MGRDSDHDYDLMLIVTTKAAYIEHESMNILRFHVSGPRH